MTGELFLADAAATEAIGRQLARILCAGDVVTMESLAAAQILRERVPTLAEDVVALGPSEERAPHITCFTVLYADGEVLVSELDRAGFAVGSGSACTADTRRPSHVLAAMGAVTHGNLRLSLAPDVTESDVGALLAALPAAIRAARDAGATAAGP